MELIRRPAHRALAAVTVVLLGVAACGGDDDDSSDGGAAVSAQEQPYVEAMVASFQTADEGDLTLDEDQAACVAPRWLETLGVERLEAAGIEPADLADGDDLSDLGLSEDEGGALYDAFSACDVAVQDLFVEAMATDQDLSDEDRECLAEQFDDDLLRRLMVAGITQGDDALDDDEELTSEVLSVFAACPGATS